MKFIAHHNPHEWYEISDRYHKEKIAACGNKDLPQVLRGISLRSSALKFLTYFSLATTNSGAHSRARLISESGNVQIAFCADSAYRVARDVAASSDR